ncbi:type I-E CRISPR-associated protein Cse1/CasA [Actinomadura syzygii]|uniref:Type I-E CRISPR-associated protein Cse1/CasA n=1 Tax=Actinomadura syzygii TaxID=1427538 RepID=A0A5D0TX75_9ACTN|nr:type I-E CRISPR-associated protein Cse1/CasA [Actinomadura syzygii]TYC10324.1 type I-E CRISPR-associated protein Cse1/CasA [Actinomadura syzygii]
MPGKAPLAAFDLTRESWLPVLRDDGTEDELSLLEVFAQADTVRRLVGDVPTQELALLRLLLAILHDVVEGPTDLEHWQQLWEDGLPLHGDDGVSEYLARHRSRFDLLHSETPFFQTAGLQTAKKEIASLDRLVADVPNGAQFFTMRARGVERLSFAEAARWVVHAHAFDTSGIKTGADKDKRAKGGKVYPLGVGWTGNLGGVFVEGANLRETLLLNLIAFDTTNLRIDADRDRPAWRHPPPGPTQMEPLELSRRPAGVRDLYTWQSRRVRLAFDDEGVHGVVLAYGDPLSPRNQHMREPMTSWRRSQAQEKKLGVAQVYLPREHDPGKSAWRGLGALVAGRTPGAEQRNEAADIVRPRILDWVARLTVEGDFDPDFLIRARLVAARYGTQQSVIDEVIDDSVAMPVVLLHERDTRLGQAAIDAVADADRAVNVLGDLAADLARAVGAGPDPARERATTQAYGMLDGSFRDWLAALDPSHPPQPQRAAWQDTARTILARLGAREVADAGDGAWEGRVIQTGKGQELWLTSSRAEATFRYRLRKALPGTAPEPEPDEPARQALEEPMEASS